MKYIEHTGDRKFAEVKIVPKIVIVDGVLIKLLQK